MPVDPGSMTMSPPPMTCSPSVIGVACVVARAANVIRPVANRDRYGARVTSIIRPTISTIVGGVITRVSGVILFTRCHPKHRTNETAQQQRAFDYHFHHTWYSDSKDDLRGLVDTGGRKFVA